MVIQSVVFVTNRSYILLYMDVSQNGEKHPPIVAAIWVLGNMRASNWWMAWGVPLKPTDGKLSQTQWPINLNLKYPWVGLCEKKSDTQTNRNHFWRTSHHFPSRPYCKTQAMSLGDDRKAPWICVIHFEWKLTNLPRPECKLVKFCEFQWIYWRDLEGK